MIRALGIAALSALWLTACSDEAGSDSAVREQIRAVGSSTVYPFTTAIAEQFVNTNRNFKSPIVESTGTGAGIKLFCAGVGANFPDIVNASRRLKRSEFDDCAKNRVTEIVEIQIGIDGISLGESRKGLGLNLTTAEVYRAIAATPFGKPQTAKTWRDINASLPAVPIVIYGPPSTSGTRDALAELILTAGCESDPAMKALKTSDVDRHKSVCTGVREDGAYVDSGENDNLIVQKISANPNAVGIFGFSFYEENRDILRDVPLNGVPATYASISDFSYPGARPLFIYVKAAHLMAIPGLREFVASYAGSLGQDGVLKKRGMIVAPADVLAKSADTARTLAPLDPATLN